jgi:predicted phage tail protein
VATNVKGIFTVEDIHEVRVKMAEERSRMTQEEAIRAIDAAADMFRHRMEERRRQMAIA